MKLGTLVAGLPKKKSAVHTLERGKSVTYPFAGLAADVAQASAALKSWGVRPGTRVGIYAPNSCRWLVYDLAILDIGAVSVPFTDDFAGKIDRELLDRYQVSLLLLARNGPQPAADMQPHIAYIDSDNGEVRAIERPSLDEAGSILTLAFSSGSAGGLKGLVVSRAGVEATLPPICDAIGLEADDRLLLFLPMSNFQQRAMYYAAIWYDFDIIITDYVQMLAGIKLLQPTILIAPPMYFQMIQARFANLPNARKGWRTIQGALISLLPVAGLRRWLAERLFSDFYQQFGPRMRLLITGMAPIKRDVAEFFDRMQLPLCESYGLVETGSLTYRPAGSRKYGSVGKPVAGVKLEFAEDGEIIVEREKSLTLCYFQSAEGENERTFIAPGRIATGDIGRMDEDGYLHLLGRKKELIVTAGGYKIHPEVVESELAGCPEIAQAAVFLKPGAASLTCVVALNRPGDAQAEANVREFVRNMKSGKASQIGEVIFADAPFTAENGMLRPNLKLDRRRIAAKYNLN
ncbi:MAG TPA: AMP-binding protein [Rhizomicrobium sp.]|nr:AMP-binding protein [Rhizomicrobium sp.]